MSNIVAIVQARMGSERLPGKSLKKIGNDSVCSKIIKRLSFSKVINKIIFAIPNTKKDDVLEAELKKYDCLVFRGSQSNVLERFFKAASFALADIVIRLTGDCPLIDAGIVDDAINFYLSNQDKYDYVSNGIEKRSFARGFDCEVFSFDVLKQAYQNVEKDYEKEHVTPYIYQNKDKFKTYDIIAPCELNRPDYRICIDTAEDFLLVSKIFEAFKGRDDMTAGEIVEFLDERPELVRINESIVQKKV